MTVNTKYDYQAISVDEDPFGCELNALFDYVLVQVTKYLEDLRDECIRLNIPASVLEANAEQYGRDIRRIIDDAFDRFNKL